MKRKPATPQPITASHFILVDPDGKTKAELSLDTYNQPRLVFFGPDGEPCLRMEIDSGGSSSGEPQITMESGEDGQAGIMLHAHGLDVADDKVVSLVRPGSFACVRE